MNTTNFEKRRADETEWHPVDEADVRKALSAFYIDVDAVIQVMQDGLTAATPWASYRIAPAIEQAGADA